MSLIRNRGASSRAGRLLAIVAAIAMLVVSGCSGSDEKSFDISPIFPLSEGKCEKYNGEEAGEGFGATCMVTKADCERAVEDWRAAMTNVQGAIEFSCE